MAALTQEDDKLQIPMISNVGNEIWKCKEAGQSVEDAPTLGDPERRAIMMECVAALCYLLAGSDVLILRHPESVRIIRSFVEGMVKGRSVEDVAGIAKKLPLHEADLLSIAPAPNLDFGKEAPPKEAAKPKEAKAAPPKAEKKEEKPKVPPKPAEKVVPLKPKAEEEAKAKAEKEAKAREDEAKAKAEAEAKAKAELEAKAAAEARQKEAEEKAKEEAKARAEAEAGRAAAAKEKEKEDLEALRQKRAEEREKREAEKMTAEAGAAAKQPTEPASLVEKMIQYLDRIHRRA
jgi:acetyl-CoA decarbonylase/synthase complex subunit delta